MPQGGKEGDSNTKESFGSIWKLQGKNPPCKTFSFFKGKAKAPDTETIKPHTHSDLNAKSNLKFKQINQNKPYSKPQTVISRYKKGINHKKWTRGGGQMTSLGPLREKLKQSKVKLPEGSPTIRTGI